MLLSAQRILARHAPSPFRELGFFSCAHSVRWRRLSRKRRAAADGVARAPSLLRDSFDVTPPPEYSKGGAATFSSTPPFTWWQFVKKGSGLRWRGNKIGEAPILVCVFCPVVNFRVLRGPRPFYPLMSVYLKRSCQSPISARSPRKGGGVRGRRGREKSSTETA